MCIGWVGERYDEAICIFINFVGSKMVHLTTISNFLTYGIGVHPITSVPNECAVPSFTRQTRILGTPCSRAQACGYTF